MLFRRRSVHLTIYLYSHSACNDHSAHHLRAQWLFESMGEFAGPGPSGNTTVQSHDAHCLAIRQGSAITALDCSGTMKGHKAPLAF